MIHRQEALGLVLLDRALGLKVAGEEIPIDVQLDVFEKVGKWVSIKNRLDDVGETQIDEFKRRIHGETPAKTAPGRAARVRDTEEQLTAIKSRLAGRGNGGNDRNSGDPGV